MNIHAITDFMTKYSFILFKMSKTIVSCEKDTNETQSNYLVESAGEFTNEIFKSAIRTIQFYSECQAKN